ncbi:four-carbon acid sugar kinase family protein [Candidatus Poribacteria bacterium]|nr:four-carbon acid sugar kinase family protein [Candidatus Poribacteria bacterium]
MSENLRLYKLAQNLMIMQPLMLKIKNRPIVVFADDLTGAMEVGLQSFPAVVLNNVDTDAVHAASAESNKTIVINTQTRELSAEQTYQVTNEKSSAISIPEGTATYYKIDSTMRAHIGAGIKAFKEALQCDLVVIAPALPQNGRITRNGVHYVDAVQVHETQYAKDIMTASPTSYIPAIIGYQLGESVQLISLDVVQQGWQNIKTALEKQPQGTVVAIDAVIPEDLDNIAEAIHLLNADVLSVGSAGLFRAICRVLGRSSNQVVPIITDWTRQLPKKRKRNPKDGRIIVIAGSLNQRTNAQIETAIATLGDKVKLLELDVNKVIARGKSRTTEIERLRGQILSSLQAKKHIVVRTNRTLLKCSQEEEDDIVKALGEAINDDAIIEKSALLLLTGGQTAYFVTQVLGASGIEVKGEIEKFIPVGILIGGKYDGVPVVTKAGGFGSQEVIANILTGMS